MPGGSAAQQSFIPEPQQESPDETGNLLAADKARDAGNLRTAAANDNYQPYTEGPANDNNVPQEEASPDYQAEIEQPTDMADMRAAEQAQLDAQQQAEAAASIQGSKQRQLRQIQMERQGIESKLSELEKDLTDFKNSKLGGFLKIFQPRMNLLIDILISEMKKQANKLTDEAKVGYYTGLVITITSLIGMLTAFKFLAAVLDAAFVAPNISCIRLVLVTSETIIIPIILILISPIYISFLALIFIMGKIPLLKGKLTKNIIDIITKLKKQKEVWQKELTRLKKVVSLKKQLKSLNKFEKQVKRWR